MPKTTRIDDDPNMPALLGQASLTYPVLGPITLVWSAKGLVRLCWGIEHAHAEVKDAPPAFAEPLRRYADGDEVDFSKIAVDLRGTDFQIDVWNALRAVRRGTVRTYAGIAADVGRPRAMRAVGMANGSNPVPIVVPCHRIVAAGNKLGGYTGGLDRKRALLTLEGVEIEGDQLLPGQLSLLE